MTPRIALALAFLGGTPVARPPVILSGARDLLVPVIPSEARDLLVPVIPRSARPSGARSRGISWAQSPSDSLIRLRVDSLMTRLAAIGFNGSVLVLRSGVPVVKAAWGWADAGRKVRADGRTTWSLGSITKQFTAAAILRLEQQGGLRTTDPVSRWFPDAPADKRNITIHQLLTHTAGFDSDYAPTDYTPNTREEYIGRMFAAPLQSPPGAEHSYSNAGYSLLAAIIEKVTGQDYEHALTALVLAPAGMRETGYTLPHWDARRVAHGYQEGRDWGTIVDRLKVPGAPFWALRGNGGLQTTLDDMTRWDAMLRTSTIFADSSRVKFMTGYVSEGGPGDSKYAYGWAVHPSRRGTRVVEHNGGNGIYVAEFKRFVDEGITIFVASAVAELRATSVIESIESIVFGDRPVTMPPVVATLPARELAALTGAWRSAAGRVDVAAQGSRLALSTDDPATWMLLATGDTAISPRARTLGQRALAIMQAAVQGDGRPMHDALAEPEPLDEVSRQLRALQADRIRNRGAYHGAFLLGAVARPDGIVVTTVGLRYDRGVATNVLAWTPAGTIRRRIARPYVPAEFVTVARGRAERFSLEPDAVAVSLDSDGKALVLVGPDGQRLAFSRPPSSQRATCPAPVHSRRARAAAPCARPASP